MRAIKDILKCTLGNETLWTTKAVRSINTNVFLSVPAYTDYSGKLLNLRLLYTLHMVSVMTPIDPFHKLQS